ncbi:RNA-directed DNA polymerase (reverse transcriptase)-related family protein [Thalictrum thalictroides]|uniref:RNA-directed DNA polymerase (Reverse transcriptase)-related family protein n=1 Tax=Thalictrum thalictroides TaxID=46969 RepID=A0A7J6XD04_THATH|nr:RNA-directed DNA polymerase (reverse transcriptase)-related family protein [Thalictrum thalictroides]
MLIIKALLLIFEATPRLKINLNKSSLIGVDDMHTLAGILIYKVETLPCKYLGLPLGAKYKSKSVWEVVLVFIQKRLAGWKRKYLSKGGRLVLIKSMLSNLPVYQMSLFTIPKSIAKRIDRVVRDFLWGLIEVLRKLHMVAWEHVCRPKEEGGLGIRSMAIMNEALLGKWLWRYGHEDNSLWKVEVLGSGGRKELLLCMVRDYGKVLCSSGILLFQVSNVYLVTVQESDFGGIRGVNSSHFALFS